MREDNKQPPEQPNNRLVNVFIDLESNWARSEHLRPKLVEELKQKLLAQVPHMVTRIAELDPVITDELGEYTEFMLEARSAFQFGLWRSVVALVGTAAESFTNDLYDRVENIRSASGQAVSKKLVFGDDDHLQEKRKLEILKLFGLLSQSNYDKLIKIKNLRDRYVHGNVKDRDIGQDARESISLFGRVLKERFDSKYTIREGKIVPRDR